MITESLLSWNGQDVRGPRVSQDVGDITRVPPWEVQDGLIDDIPPNDWTSWNGQLLRLTTYWSQISPIQRDHKGRIYSVVQIGHIWDLQGLMIFSPTFFSISWHHYPENCIFLSHYTIITPLYDWSYWSFGHDEKPDTGHKIMSYWISLSDHKIMLILNHMIVLNHLII